MPIKIILSIVATVIAFISYAPYIRDLHRGKTKPHAFSWLIWTLIAYIAGFAQIKGGGGTGAWVAIVSATITLYITIVSFRDGSVKFTKTDKLSLFSCLIAIPIWAITNKPLLAVILVTAIDAVGFWPTIRKGFHLPHEETLSNYWLAAIKNCMVILALNKYNLVTVLYPASTIITDGSCFILLSIRLKRLGAVTELRS